MTCYEERIATFVAGYRGLSRQAGVVACFHDIRNFRYLSDGVRDPDRVLQRKAGSCSGKHMVLRDCLLAVGEDAYIETVEGDFAAGVPVHASMSPGLQALVRDKQVQDFHQFVMWQGVGGACRLDATWPDGLVEFGFEVNASWQGVGDTKLALAPDRFHGRSDDIQKDKAELLATLLPAQVERRSVFLDEFSKWVAIITNAPKGGNNVH